MKLARLKNRCILVEDNIIYSPMLDIIGVDDSSIKPLTMRDIPNLPDEAVPSLLDCLGALVWTAIMRHDEDMLIEAARFSDVACATVDSGIENQSA